MLYAYVIKHAYECMHVWKSDFVFICCSYITIKHDI